MHSVCGAPAREGGIDTAHKGFLQGPRDLCDDARALLVPDKVHPHDLTGLQCPLAAG